LAWSEAFGSRDEAFAAERKIKGWSRAKKQALMNRDWPSLSVLSHRRSRNYDAPPIALRDAVHGTAPQDERLQEEIA